ncbi:MAG: hypothetical protein SF097_18255 [Acidobacteriota bacterium]|nr:hypothetical protein [Acidobacteriota bacterium]
MRVIRYNLELIQPVLIPDPQGEANSAISLSYIPGALVRGALIGLYRKAFDAADSDIRALFLGDATRYLNAYPVLEERRALPVSAAWRYDKIEKPQGEKAARRIYNFAVAQPGKDFNEETVDASFAWLKEAELAERFNPPRQVNVHTQRNPRKGRAIPRKGKKEKYDPAAGTVYRYDALAAGLVLQGVILTEAEQQLADQLETLLQQNQTLWIGRARRAGYGEVRITVVADEGLRENGSDARPPEVRPPSWQSNVVENPSEPETFESSSEDESDEHQDESESNEDSTPYPGHLSLMLTSDALLRDEWGQATLDPSAAVAEALGVPPTTFTLQPDSSFLTTRVVGGFNRKWGLQLPQMLALAAGSTFDLATKEPLSTEQLERLEQCGIGERRNEGFGQVLVRSEEKAEIHSERAEPPNPLSGTLPPKLNETEKQFARTLAERMLRRKLDVRLRELVNRIDLHHAPLKHQIARLRVLLRAIERERQPNQLIAAEKLDFLNRYLRNTADRRAGEQLARAQIEEKPSRIKATLPLWIKAQLLPQSEEFADGKNKDVFQAAQQRWSDLEVKFGADVTAKVNDVLAQEYALRLVNQVLQRAAKLARTNEKEAQNG